jgi:hypothetical protein
LGAQGVAKLETAGVTAAAGAAAGGVAGNGVKGSGVGVTGGGGKETFSEKLAREAREAKRAVERANAHEARRCLVAAMFSSDCEVVLDRKVSIEKSWCDKIVSILEAPTKKYMTTPAPETSSSF